MITVVDGKRSSVFFDPKNNTYIKTFSPKLKNKIKYFLKLRKYPGENFFYISTLLKNLGIKTVEVVEYSPYRVVTKKLDGVILFDYLKENPNDENIENQYIELVTKVLKSNIYCGDLNLFNFIVSNNELYALDLEDYKYEKIPSRSQEEALRRLEEKVPPHIYKKVKDRF